MPCQLPRSFANGYGAWIWKKEKIGTTLTRRTSVPTAVLQHASIFDVLPVAVAFVSAWLLHQNG